MARRKEFEPAEALDKAMDLFWRRGYESTSIEDLVDGMGIKRQSLYDTFGDKHTLFLAALDRYFEVSVCERLKMLERPGSVLAAIRRFFRSLVELTGTESARHGCMVVNSVMELAAHDKEAGTRVTAVLAWVEESFYKALVRAQEQGELADRHTPRALARFLTCVMLGRSVLGKANTSRKAIQDAVDVALSLLE